jgi:glycerophosphoryl diester phosphodiesterase
MSETVIPQLVAHRGYLQRYPENTWAALEAALGAGACWLEFDVQLCRDDRFVLMHDDNLQRTAGIDHPVLTSDSAALTDSVHEPDRFGERFAPTPVPLLDDVLARLSARPAARAMVEIKQESIALRGLDTVMELLLPVLQRHRSQCTLISYSYEALAWLRQRADVPVGWVLSDYNAQQRDQATALAPDYLICNVRKLTPAHTPWPGPWQWMLYDIVDPEQALAWAAHGVALIETADIGAMLLDPRLAQRACHHDSL